MRKNFYPVADKNYVVLGLGRTGQATLDWLRDYNADAVGWDDSEVVRNSIAHTNHRIVDPYGCNWDEVTALVQSPGIALSHRISQEAMAANVPIITDLELLQAQSPKATYIGVTGTNGKSTTVALLNHTLCSSGRKVSCGGNIGNAALTLPAMTEDNIYILELSSYQLELAHTLKMDIAVLLNISEDHLARHGDMSNYVATKSKIFRDGDQLAVISMDDAYSMQQYDKRKDLQVIIPLTTQSRPKGGVFVADGFLYDHRHAQGTPIFDFRNIQALAGRHNHHNAAAVYAIATHLGMAPEDVLATFHTFRGLPHRQEVVREMNGLIFVNDSKGTNPEATARALESYKNIYWIVGGQPKDNNWDILDNHLSNVKQAFLIGESMRQMAAFLQGKVPYAMSESIFDAVRQAFKQVQIDGSENAVILLSPACASFDQFKDFEQRGEAFRNIVLELKNPNEQAMHVG